MNWDDLRFVLAVGRTGTLAAAARSLKMDATTVGRRVLAIETSLGSRLFDRTAAGYLPTHAGHEALAHAEAMERTAISLSHQIEGSEFRTEGPVRLTGLDAIFDRFIIPRLPQLLARYPGLEITFTSSPDFVDLSRREADIALRTREPSHPDSVGRKLGQVAQAAYVAKGLVPGDAPPLIGLPRENDGTGFSRLLQTLFPAGRIAARGNSEGHILALTRAGIGVGILDCFVGDGDPVYRRGFFEVAIPIEDALGRDMMTAVEGVIRIGPRIGPNPLAAMNFDDGLVIAQFRVATDGEPRLITMFPVGRRE